MIPTIEIPRPARSFVIPSPLCWRSSLPASDTTRGGVSATTAALLRAGQRRDLVKDHARALEHGCRDTELRGAEIGERLGPHVLVARPLLGDKLTAARRQGDQHQAAVTIASRALDEAGADEAVEHLGRRCRGDLGEAGELRR